MVIYKVSPRDPFALLWGLIPAQVLTCEIFSDHTDLVVLTEMQNGKRLQRPTNTESSGITDPIWMPPEKCWDWQRRYCPNSAHVLNAIREVHQSRDVGVAAPARSKLKMKDVVNKLTKRRNINISIPISRSSMDPSSTRHRVP